MLGCWGNFTYGVMNKAYLQGMPSIKALCAAAAYEIDINTGTVGAGTEGCWRGPGWGRDRSGTDRAAAGQRC